MQIYALNTYTEKIEETSVKMSETYKQKYSYYKTLGYTTILFRIYYPTRILCKK